MFGMFYDFVLIIFFLVRIIPLFCSIFWEISRKVKVETLIRKTLTKKEKKDFENLKKKNL
jgi:hypothetical protein